MNARKHTVGLMHRKLDIGGGDSKRVNDPQSLLTEADERFIFFVSCFTFLCFLMIELFTPAVEEQVQTLLVTTMFLVVGLET
jgi:hypothetical protein